MMNFNYTNRIIKTINNNFITIGLYINNSFQIFSIEYYTYILLMEVIKNKYIVLAVLAFI